ncbi:unnamed protein product, partial [Brassica oleracea var. botrytis]
EKRRGLNEPSASETGALTCISYGSLSGERSLQEKKEGPGQFDNEAKSFGTSMSTHHILGLKKVPRVRSLLALSTDGKGVTTLGGRAKKVEKGRGEQANGRRGERERSERTNIL